MYAVGTGDDICEVHTSPGSKYTKAGTFMWKLMENEKVCALRKFIDRQNYGISFCISFFCETLSCFRNPLHAICKVSFANATTVFFFFLSTFITKHFTSLDIALQKKIADI